MIMQSSLPSAEKSHKSKAIALHALHLAQGSTMLSTTMKTGTIKYYLVASASVALNHK